jgi:hypothetical protein
MMHALDPDSDLPASALLSSASSFAEQPPTPPAAKNIEKVDGSFAERAVALGDELAAECNCFSCRPGFVEKVAAFAQQVAAESEAKYGPLVKAAEDMKTARERMRDVRGGVHRVVLALDALRSPEKSREAGQP